LHLNAVAWLTFSATDFATLVRSIPLGFLGLYGLRRPAQKRKWQDRSGADRHTTEIVLQRFRGELQLLDEAPKEGEAATGR
jgi:hypothetical protein